MSIESKRMARRLETHTGHEKRLPQRRRAPHWLMWVGLLLCLALIPLSDALHGCLGASDQVACRAASREAARKELSLTPDAGSVESP